MSSTPTAQVPKSLFGYEVVERLGEGALSTIYAVDDPKTKQLYALKHVVPSDEKHLRFIEQLENEFKHSRTFRHPALRKCVAFKTRKKLFGGIAEAMLLMELVDGTPLSRACPDEVPEVVDVFVKVLDALAALHHYNILHCDTKPGNIMRESGGGVRLIDFGQACLNGATKERVQGTPDFIAPEQARCRQLHYCTDVYNFGASMYWALTGGRKVPTLLTVPKEQMEVLKEQQFATPADLNQQVPQGLSELVMDCVNVRPAYRPQTAAEVMQRLVPYGSGQSGAG